MYDMDYKWYDFQLKFVLIREYWFVILRLLDDYLLNLWSSEHSDIPYLLMIILFARWKYYSQQVLWDYTRDKMYRWSFESKYFAIYTNNLVKTLIFFKEIASDEISQDIALSVSSNIQIYPINSIQCIQSLLISLRIIFSRRIILR